MESGQAAIQAAGRRQLQRSAELLVFPAASRYRDVRPFRDEGPKLTAMTKETQPSRPVIGVDIGGTKVAVGLVDADGKILAQVRQAMIANSSPETALEAVTSAIDSLIAQVSG